MRTVVAIAVAGALGALARYGLAGLVSRRLPGAFPWSAFAKKGSPAAKAPAAAKSSAGPAAKPSASPKK